MVMSVELSTVQKTNDIFQSKWLFPCSKAPNETRDRQIHSRMRIIQLQSKQPKNNGPWDGDYQNEEQVELNFPRICHKKSGKRFVREYVKMKERNPHIFWVGRTTFMKRIAMLTSG